MPYVLQYDNKICYPLCFEWMLSTGVFKNYTGCVCILKMDVTGFDLYQVDFKLTRLRFCLVQYLSLVQFLLCCSQLS